MGVKRLGREAYHSPPSSAEVKNARSYTSTPQYAFMAWCLVKHRDNNFTLTFISILESELVFNLQRFVVCICRSVTCTQQRKPAEPVSSYYAAEKKYY
jgi:hypothetical protein